MTNNQIKLYCGDYRQVLRNVQADLIFTSPPYNIGSKSPRIDGHRKDGGYDPKSYGAIRDYPDSLPEEIYQFQQAEFMIWAAEHLATDGTLVYNHKPRRNGRMIHPGEWFLWPDVREKLVLTEDIVWNRGSTHNHGKGLMWPQTERLYVFRRAGEKYRLKNTSRLKHRSDVWDIPRAPGNGHNAPFPLELAREVIEAWSSVGDLVCDPYMGSGTTGVAALEMGRAFVGSEILRKYYQMAEKAISQVREKAS